MEIFRVLAAEFIPVAVLSGFIFYERWRRKRRRERPPIQDKLLRTAGYTLSKKIEDLNDSIATFLVAAITSALVLAFVLMRPDPKNPTADALIWIVMGVTSAFCIAVVFRKAIDLSKYRLGLLGEQFMAEQLHNLADYRVFHDIPGEGKWNVDHVAVGPAGVFAIETKCPSKRRSRNKLREHEATFDGATICYPWCEDRDAADQARRNAKWLGNMLTKATGERVVARPIVALPGWFVNLTADSEIKALSGKQVTGYITAQPTTLSAKTIQQIAYQLEQRCRDVEF
jgi:hypothetical protein